MGSPKTPNTPLQLVAMVSKPSIPDSTSREAWLKFIEQIDEDLKIVSQFSIRQIEKEEEDSLSYDALCDCCRSSLAGRQFCRNIRAVLRRRRGSRGDPDSLIPKDKLEALRREYNNVFDSLRTVFLSFRQDHLLRELPSAL